MAATRTTQSDLLKIVYQPKMRIQFNLKSILLQELARNEAEYAEGEKFSIPIHSGQTVGYGWSPAGVLPAASNQQVARATFNYERMYGRIQLDGPHTRGARKGYAADARPYDLETRGLVMQMRSAFNFDLFGDGTAILSLFPSQTATVSGTAVTALTVDSVKGLVKGQRVDLLATADGADTNGFSYAVIVSINTDAGTGVHTLTLTTSDGTWDPATFNAAEASYGLYRSLNSSTSCYGNAVEGLSSIVSASGTYGGINRATAGNEYWKAQAIDAGDGAADKVPYLSLIEQAIDKVDINSDGATNLIITTHELWAYMMKTLVNNKRYTLSETKLNGWARAIDFNGIPIIRDKHCPDGKMFFLDMSTFALFQDSEGQWMDEDGAILHRVTDSHAYEASWFRFVQLVCDQPAANCVIYDLTSAYPTT